MSEFHIISTSAPPPPTVPTSFVTQDGTAVPAANILIVNGFDSTENNANGIITKGGVVGTGTSNEVDVVITNRIQGTVTTVGATTSPIITFTPLTVGTYAIEIRISAFNTTATLGAGYSVFGTARFDGVNSNLCGTPDRIVNEEGAMSSANATMTVSGANILINGVGYAAQTINWSAVGLYTFVGA
jgi:hypothetical protein